MLFLFSLLYFVESHIVVLLDSSYLNIPNHYFRFSVLDFHCIVPLLVDGHSSFTMLLSDSGMIRCHLACPSQSDGHDVPSLSVGLSRIFLFVSVTELLPLEKFSRHAKAQTSLALVIWLNENILIQTSSFMTFPGEASHADFFCRKVSASRILQVPGALFPEFFQKLFAVCRASNKNFSWPKGEIIR
jgi:hypothetical protein